MNGAWRIGVRLWLREAILVGFALVVAHLVEARTGRQERRRSSLVGWRHETILSKTLESDKVQTGTGSATVV